jgi:hypothetical protein
MISTEVGEEHIVGNLALQRNSAVVTPIILTRKMTWIHGHTAKFEQNQRISVKWDP